MKIWYSIFSHKAYDGDEPAFYNTKDFGWTDTLERNWISIRNELADHLSENPRLRPEEQEQTVNHHGAWKAIRIGVTESNA